MRQTEQLQKEYLKRKAAGKSDEELSEVLKAAMPAIQVFNQIDADHSGTVSNAEVHRLLRCMPRHTLAKKANMDLDDSVGKQVSLEEMVSAFDDDGDGEIDLEEFVGHLEKLVHLREIIMGNIDPVTGKLKGYLSIEAQIEELQSKALSWEIKAWEAAKIKALEGDAMGDEAIEKSDGLEWMNPADKSKLLQLRNQIKQLQGMVSSAGLAFFRQIDLDRSGTVDRDELLAALKDIPPALTKDGGEELEELDAKDAFGRRRMSKVSVVTLENIDEVLEMMDVDKDGTVDEDEWVSQLERLPLLKAALEAAIDPKTGKIMDYANSEAVAPTSPAHGGGMPQLSMNEADEDSEAEEDDF